MEKVSPWGDTSSWKTTFVFINTIFMIILYYSVFLYSYIYYTAISKIRTKVWAL